MSDIVYAIQEGRTFFWIVLVTGLFGLALPVVQLVMLRKIDLSPLIIGSIIGTFLMGLLAATDGVIMGTGALDMAAPEQRANYLARGISASLNNTALTVLIGSVQLFLGAIVLTVRANVGQKTSEG